MEITRNGDEVEITLASESPLVILGIHSYETELHPNFFGWLNRRAKTIAVIHGYHFIQMIMTFEPEIQKEVDNYLTLVRVAGLQAVETYDE